jgi:hypothetical protein
VPGRRLKRERRQVRPRWASAVEVVVFVVFVRFALVGKTSFASAPYPALAYNRSIRSIPDHTDLRGSSRLNQPRRASSSHPLIQQPPPKYTVAVEARAVPVPGRRLKRERREVRPRVRGRGTLYLSCSCALRLGRQDAVCRSALSSSSPPLLPTTDPSDFTIYRPRGSSILQPDKRRRSHPTGRSSNNLQKPRFLTTPLGRQRRLAGSCTCKSTR